jgi:hypothetical protein
LARYGPAKLKAALPLVGKALNPTAKEICGLAHIHMLLLTLKGGLMLDLILSNKALLAKASFRECLPLIEDTEMPDAEPDDNSDTDEDFIEVKNIEVLDEDVEE